MGQQILAERPRVTVRRLVAISAMGFWSWRGGNCPLCSREETKRLGGLALRTLPALP